MNRKADLHITLGTLIDLIMVTAALLVLFFIYLGVMNIINGNPDKDVATMNNFQELVTQINSMDANKPTEIPLYINEGWFVIGFQKDIGQYAPTIVCTPGIKSIIQKPASCSANCLCLCSIKDSCIKNAQCKTIEGDFTFQPTGGCSFAVIMGAKKVQSVSLYKDNKIVRFGLKQ
jgi:hypothetical protein